VVKQAGFSKALFVPLLLMAGLTISWHYSDEYLSTALKWVLYLLYVVLFVVTAVTSHRLVLLDTREIAFQYKTSWSLHVVVRVDAIDEAGNKAFRLISIK
jgi:hypothetical protein